MFALRSFVLIKAQILAAELFVRCEACLCSSLLRFHAFCLRLVLFQPFTCADPAGHLSLSIKFTSCKKESGKLPSVLRQAAENSQL